MLNSTKAQENTILEKFNADKIKTQTAINEYLEHHDVVDLDTNHQENAQDAANTAIDLLIKDGTFEDALQKLESLRDAKTNIKTIEDKTKGVLIRDARQATDPRILSSEAFEMQYLNAARSAIDIIELSKDVKEENKEKAKNAIRLSVKASIDAIRSASDSNLKEDAQKKYNKHVKKRIQALGQYLEKQGIKEPFKQLNIAKDFQNFNDTHLNIVTITKLGEVTAIESEVALKGLTENQKEEYKDINNKPWFEKLTPLEKKLVEKYKTKITGGQHVIPTQLRQIVGMKNAFEKTTQVYKGNKLDTLHTSKHAGTLASLSKSSKDERQRITNLNADQAKAWIGNEKTLHCNTLNSKGNPFNKDDDKIVSMTTNAMKGEGRSITNSAFNIFRYLGLANDFSGAEELLENLDKKEGLNNDAKFEQLDESIKSLKQALSKAKKSTFFKIFSDGENSSLQVATALNQVNNAIAKLGEEEIAELSLPQQEMLIMCASGKDRTGLAEHDLSAQALRKCLGNMKIQEIDKALLNSGHTAQQAGGISAGGATSGCYGTKSENKAGIPSSRKDNLMKIIEKSANSNKIKESKTSLFKQIKQMFSTKKQDKIMLDAVNKAKIKEEVEATLIDAVNKAKSKKIKQEKFKPTLSTIDEVKEITEKEITEKEITEKEITEKEITGNDKLLITEKVQPLITIIVELKAAISNYDNATPDNKARFIEQVKKYNTEAKKQIDEKSILYRQYNDLQKKANSITEMTQSSLGLK